MQGVDLKEGNEVAQTQTQYASSHCDCSQVLVEIPAAIFLTDTSL